MAFDEIQLIFFQECEEGLAQMEASFLVCRDGQQDAETINTIFRAIHSIKGGAGAFGHEALREFSHHYETVLDTLRNGELALTPDLLATALAAFDMLADHVAAARDGVTAPNDAAVLARLGATGGAEAPPVAAAGPAAAAMPFDEDEIPIELDDLMAMLDGPAPEAAAVPWRVRFTPIDADLANGGEPLLLLRELERLGGTAEVDLTRLPTLDALMPGEACLDWTCAVPGEVAEDDIRDVFDFLAGAWSVVRADAETIPEPTPPTSLPQPAAPELPAPPTAPAVAIQAAPAAEPSPRSAPPPAQAAQTIRVDLDKLDRLVNLVGELVITQAMLAQRLSVANLAAISELSDLDHLTRELQDSAMSIRAQPMKTVFSRVPRIIRELEADTGKRVRLDVEGEMTEVDKTVVERIGEPLTHMIRNAVDHGLESTADRVASGKPAEGVVKLAAEHRSGRIVISVTDDGRGIDREAVRRKAIERGLIAADAPLGDEEIDNLIFAPGFSTAATVSSISGRGVGMDVVRKNVQALGGRIGITSRPGAGSTFSLSLPLTLAVVDGMIVRVGDQTFVLPLTHIVESLRPAAREVKRLGTDKSLLDVRGAYIPILPLHEQLGIGGAETDPTLGVLIVVESDSGRAVLMADMIVDQRQVVVKSLEANYAAVPGLAGATILGDGRVALILDVDALVLRSRSDARATEAPANLAA